MLHKAIFSFAILLQPMFLQTLDNVFNLLFFSEIAWRKGELRAAKSLKLFKASEELTYYNNSSEVPEPDNSDCMRMCVCFHMSIYAHAYCPLSCAWFPDWHYFSCHDDLILVPMSYLVADIPRIDSFGHKARQKDEVQNCVLLTSAAYALQEDVQGWDSLLQCHELRGRW